MAPEGADRVNDELEVGFDESFERRFHTVEIAGRCVMLLIVLAALLGFLGEGPFSHRIARDRSGAITVDYEPVSRFGTATQITLHLRDSSPHSQMVHLSGSFGEPLGLQQALPTPISEVADKDGFDLVFGTPETGGTVMARLMVKPSAIGRIPLSVEVGGTSLSWTQLVLP